MQRALNQAEFSPPPHPCPKIDTELHMLVVHWPGSELQKLTAECLFLNESTAMSEKEIRRALRLNQSPD